SKRDWSSDVCSSDLAAPAVQGRGKPGHPGRSGRQLPRGWAAGAKSSFRYSENDVQSAAVAIVCEAAVLSPSSLSQYLWRREMPNVTEVPVLIVGGGAVGCVLSMELARRGVEYRCIERMPGPGRESRAIAMHARTVELLDLVDKKLSRRILERDLWCKGYVMHFIRDGERTEVRPGLDYTTVDSRYNCIFAHNQSETETFVRD